MDWNIPTGHLPGPPHHPKSITSSYQDRVSEIVTDMWQVLFRVCLDIPLYIIRLFEDTRLRIRKKAFSYLVELSIELPDVAVLYLNPLTYLEHIYIIMETSNTNTEKRHSPPCLLFCAIDQMVSTAVSVSSPTPTPPPLTVLCPLQHDRGFTTEFPNLDLADGYLNEDCYC